jgi:hypothetical protein
VSGYEAGPLPGGFPERRLDPWDDVQQGRDRTHVCGCGRGCTSWPDHHARIDKEDADDEREARADRIARRQ